MSSAEFCRFRSVLNKTQREMAQLLGTSTKAIQSFEQGWRTIPNHVERQVLLLLYLVQARTRSVQRKNCWTLRRCPAETRSRCPAWELGAGWLCWFVNGTLCHGESQASWGEKMEICRCCEVFLAAFATGHSDATAPAGKRVRSAVRAGQ